MATQCPKCKAENPDTQKFCGECATPLHPAGAVGVTKTLETPAEEYARGIIFADRYKIIEKLGTGGMGAVYRVEDTNIAQDIALKVMRPDIASEKKTIERFCNELKITRMISHRNVCRMFDLVETERTFYITMEYVPGEDLKSFIRRSGKLDIPKAISIAKEVCEGLSEAHGLGVVHRDLKSSNIMIDKEGHARIMDFGIARSQRAKGITGEGIIIGTPEYMSPEQAEAKEVDHRSDVYSLGVILYEMVTGQLPFEGDTPLAIAMKHKSEAPEDPNSLNSQVPDDLNRVILKCLAKEKEHRYQNAEEVIADLGNIEKGLPTTDRMIPKRKTLTSKEFTVTFGLKKMWIPAAVVVAVIFIGIALWSPWSKKKTIPVLSSKPSVAIPYFENNTGNSQLDYLKRGLSELLITDLSQSKYIDVTTGDRIYSILNNLDLVDVEKYSTENLVEIASRAGVNHILTGSFIRLGEYFIMTVTVQNIQSGEIVRSIEKRSLDESDIRNKIDEITRELKTVFNLTEEQIALDPDKKIGELTTSSPLAYRYFIEGMDHQIKSDFREAIHSMEKAIDIDPEFAMAYRFLAQGKENLGFIKESRKYFEEAFELRHRLSDRERYQIEGSYYIRSYLTADNAVESMKKKLELYPDDWLGNTLLGYWYMDFEEWDKAIEVQEYVLRMDDPTFWPFFHITESYTAKGLYDKAMISLEYCRDKIVDNYRIALTFVDLYICRGEYDLALKELENALSYSPPDLWAYYMMRNHTYILANRLLEAESLCLEMLNSDETERIHQGMKELVFLKYYQGKFESVINLKEHFFDLAEKRGDAIWNIDIHMAQAYAHFNIGNYEDALREAEDALVLAYDMELFRPISYSLYMKCRILIAMGDLEKAASSAYELKNIIDRSVYKKHERFAYDLLGQIEMKKDNWDEAVKYFEKALSLMHFQKTREENDHARFFESLAEAYYLKGDLNQSRELYNKIINLTTGRIFYGDVYVRSFYMLGKIHEQRSNTAKAIEHYEKFLDLWKDADPGIAEIDDASEKLSALRNQ